MGVSPSKNGEVAQQTKKGLIAVLPREQPLTNGLNRNALLAKSVVQFGYACVPAWKLTDDFNFCFPARLKCVPCSDSQCMGGGTN